MTKEEKALAACKEYDRLMIEIKKNTTTIGDGLEYCTRREPVPSAPWLKEIPEGKQSHLAEAFESFDGGTDFPVRCYHTPEDIKEIIGECSGCLRAYKAVQERKANKKKLGAIRRTIRAIGRAA